MVRPRYSFSSRHNRKTENIRKQRKKYPSIAQSIIESSDIILEVLDARFAEETRNEAFEKEIFNKNRRIIYVLNKSDLVQKRNLDKIHLYPRVFISCIKRRGIRDLRNLIKKEARMVEKIIDKDKSGKVTVGIIGYPNTGKSSLINLLIGKSSAGVSAQSGFTRSLQKLKLAEDIQLLDSPGVIPEKDYSSSDVEKIAKHAKLGARDYSKVNDPEMAIAELVSEFSEALEKHYGVKFEGDSEIFIEKLGRKKGFMTAGGKVNDDKTSRFILKEWQAGKIKI
jgi:hypothetical protein